MKVKFEFWQLIILLVLFSYLNIIDYTQAYRFVGVNWFDIIIPIFAIMYFIIQEVICLLKKPTHKSRSVGVL